MIRRIGIPAAGKRKSFALLGKLFLLAAVFIDVYNKNK